MGLGNDSGNDDVAGDYNAPADTSYGGWGGTDYSGSIMDVIGPPESRGWSPIDEYGEPTEPRGLWAKHGIGFPSLITIGIMAARKAAADIKAGKKATGYEGLNIDFDNPSQEDLIRLGSMAMQQGQGGNPSFGEWWKGSSANPNAQSTWVRPEGGGGQYQLDQSMKNPGYSGPITWEGTKGQTFPWMEGDPRYKAFQEGGYSYDPNTGQITGGGGGAAGGAGNGTTNQLQPPGVAQQYFNYYNQGGPAPYDYNQAPAGTYAPTAQGQGKGGEGSLGDDYRGYDLSQGYAGGKPSPLNPNDPRYNQLAPLPPGMTGQWDPRQNPNAPAGPVPDLSVGNPKSGQPGLSDNDYFAMGDRYGPALNNNTQNLPGGNQMGPYANINDQIWQMYNTGRGDIETGRDQGILDIQNAIASGRTDIANALIQARQDVERGVATGRADLTDYYGKARGDLEGYYGKSRADLLAGQDKGLGYYDPYVQAGTRSLGTLEGMMAAGPGKFEESPGYQFRLGEGIKAMERASSARGGTGALFDPRLYKELETYGQGMATDEYDKFINRYYQSLTPYQTMVQGVGMPAAGASADIAYGTGQNLANIGMQTGTNLAQTGLTTGSNLANLAYGGGQTMGGYGMTAGTNLANMGMQGGLQNALLRSNAGTSLAGLGQDAAKTATSNILQKEGLGIDWAKLMLGETEAEKGRAWQTGESALDRANAERLAQLGYNFYGDQASRNRNTNMFNNILGAGAMGLGFALM